MKRKRNNVDFIAHLENLYSPSNGAILALLPHLARLYSAESRPCRAIVLSAAGHNGCGLGNGVGS